MRIGLLSNPQSERNKRGMADIEKIVADTPELVHRIIDPSTTSSDLLAELADERIEILVCNSGDGTVQGVMSCLFNGPHFATPPLFAIMPRGMANMTAADVGLRGRAVGTLQRLINTVRAGRVGEHLVRRPVLKVDYSQQEPPAYGMFFGGAGIYDVIQLCKGDVHSKGLKGEWSHAATLAGILVASIFRGLESLGLHRHHVGVRIDDGEQTEEELLIAIATTLDRLVLRSRPFWNVGEAPVRFMRIAYPAKGLLRYARRVLYGNDQRRLPPEHFKSTGAQRVALRLDTPFTIDGEFFTPSPERPVVITAERWLDFVRL